LQLMAEELGQGCWGNQPLSLQITPQRLV
jgi:hypothetical protein